MHRRHRTLLTLHKRRVTQPSQGAELSGEGSKCYLALQMRKRAATQQPESRFLYKEPNSGSFCIKYLIFPFQQGLKQNSILEVGIREQRKWLWSTPTALHREASRGSSWSKGAYVRATVSWTGCTQEPCLYCLLCDPFLFLYNGANYLTAGFWKILSNWQILWVSRQIP